MTNYSLFKINILKIMLILSIVLLVSCDDTQLSLLKSDAKIVAFGDSLTFGVGASQDKNYPAVLQTLTGMNVINSGISGETTSQGLQRFQSVLEAHLPDLIILLEGGNDILRNQDLAATKQNLARMIEIAQTSGIQIILIGVPEKKLFSNSAPLYSELAEAYNLVFDDELLSDLLHNNQLKSDPIHLNNAGYQQLAEGIYLLMQNKGAF